MTAAEWVALFRDSRGSDEDRARFVDWLQESPANIAEYLELSGIWHDVGPVVDSMELEPNADVASNVVPLLVEQTSMSTSVSGGLIARRRRRATHLWISVAMAAAVAVGIGLWLANFDSSIEFSTATGEQRSIPLNDGSLVSLNTQSKVRISLEGSERRIELLTGEALFDVSTDPNRPFIVTAGETEIRVVGTTFNVYRRADESLSVAVLEGRVALMPTNESDPILLAPLAGQASEDSAPQQAIELTIEPQSGPNGTSPEIGRRSVDTERVVAWMTRRLVFDNSSLAEVVAEFNRYNTSMLEVLDPELSELRLSGVFDARDPDSMIEFLRRSRGIRVVPMSGSRRLLAPEL